MKGRAHGCKEGHLLFLAIFRNTELFLAQVGHVVSFGGGRYHRNGDQIRIDL
jgi:hypothetical protein